MERISNIITPPKNTIVFIVMQTAPNLRVNYSNMLQELSNCIANITPYLIYIFYTLHYQISIKYEM